MKICFNFIVQNTVLIIKPNMKYVLIYYFKIVMFFVIRLRSVKFLDIYIFKKLLYLKI